MGRGVDQSSKNDVPELKKTEYVVHTIAYVACVYALCSQFVDSLVSKD
jgi:hypothetical protein